jgi:dsRNA-specific ribonuclease
MIKTYPRGGEMIVFVRTANIARGKTANAIAFAQKIAEYIKDKHGVELQVLLPVGGNPLRVAWTSRHESLADVEQLLGALMADQDYMNTVSEGSVNFIEGSISDQMWVAR